MGHIVTITIDWLDDYHYGFDIVESMVKAIIFDCFGVLATDGWTPFRDEHFENNQALLDQSEILSRKMNTGIIDYPTFVQKISKLAGVSPETLDKRIDSNIPNAALMGFIRRELKPKYKIGVLSNSGANWLDVIFSKSQMAIFDAVAMSYEMGQIKPDPRAYEIIAERLKVPVESCLFIDNQERFCKAARDAGMQAIQYQSFAQIKKVLREYLN